MQRSTKMGISGLSRRIQKHSKFYINLIILFVLLNLILKAIYKHHIEWSAPEEKNKEILEEKKSKAVNKSYYSKKMNVWKGGEGLRIPKKRWAKWDIAGPSPPPLISADILMRQQNRKKLLQENCKRMNIGLWKTNKSSNLTGLERIAVSNFPKIPHYQSLLVSENLKLSYCPVQGSGADWMSKVMLQLNEKKYLYIGMDEAYKIARREFPYLNSWNRYPEVLEKTNNLLIIRHPFDRLMESYKVIFDNPEFSYDLFKKYSTFIVRMYRKDHNDDSVKPTFAEFCRFVFDQNTLPEHILWKPFTQVCTPCHIPFNIIVEYETLFQEIMWAIKQMNLAYMGDSGAYVDYWITPEIREKYFSFLTKEEILKLYEKYKLDFELLGYDIQNFMKYHILKQNNTKVLGVNSKLNNLTTSSAYVLKGQETFSVNKTSVKNNDAHTSKTKVKLDDERVLHNIDQYNSLNTINNSSKLKEKS